MTINSTKSVTASLIPLLVTTVKFLVSVHSETKVNEDVIFCVKFPGTIFSCVESFLLSSYQVTLAKGLLVIVSDSVTRSLSFTMCCSFPCIIGLSTNKRKTDKLIHTYGIEMYMNILIHTEYYKQCMLSYIQYKISYIESECN